MPVSETEREWEREMQMTGAAGGGAGGGAAAGAATGCFKCGRPGHWSRDCPSSSSATNPNPNPNPNPRTPFSSSSKFPQQPASGKASTDASSATKRLPRTRPKLTPDLLLSEDGLGYVLRHFPRSFKYHGRGHEVKFSSCLWNLAIRWFFFEILSGSPSSYTQSASLHLSCSLIRSILLLIYGCYTFDLRMVMSSLISN